MTAPSVIARRFRPAESASYKLIYLARRHPGMAAEAFPAAWRAHSRLARTFATSLGSHFRDVRQCVRDPVDGLAPVFADSYDGASILAMRSWADLMAARYHRHALDELARDEARVFAGAVDDWTMAVEEDVLRDAAPGDHAILSFLAPDAATDLSTFLAESRAWAAGHAAIAARPRRIVWNRVVDPARAWPFAVVTEAWYADRAAAIADARSRSFAGLPERRGIADADRSVHMLVRLNLAGTATGGGDAILRSEPR